MKEMEQKCAVFASIETQAYLLQTVWEKGEHNLLQTEEKMLEQTHILEVWWQTSDITRQRTFVGLRLYDFFQC